MVASLMDLLSIIALKFFSTLLARTKVIGAEKQFDSTSLLDMRLGI